MSLMNARLALTGYRPGPTLPFRCPTIEGPDRFRRLFPLPNRYGTALAFRRTSARSESMRRTSLRKLMALPAVIPLTARATSKQCLTCMSTLTARAVASRLPWRSCVYPRCGSCRRLVRRSMFRLLLILFTSLQWYVLR